MNRRGCVSPQISVLQSGSAARKARFMLVLIRYADRWVQTNKEQKMRSTTQYKITT